MTRTSVICRNNDSGFTLIELVVILAIIALLSSVVLPQLYGVERSARYAAQKSSLLHEIGNLGYRAYVSGKPIALSSEGKLPIDIPPNWQIILSRPINYDFNGICSGGTLVLVSPDGRREEIQLSPPLCSPG